MNHKSIEDIRILAIMSHTTVQTYGRKEKPIPYLIHLEWVVKTVEKFGRLLNLPDDILQDLIKAAWLHDSIEDARLTYNDIFKLCNERVAELVYAVTNEKGKKRPERANDKYYREMKLVQYAVFLKLCDRIANVEFGLADKSRQCKMYREEQPEFKEKIYTGNHIEQPLWDHLDELFKQINY